MVYKDQLKQFVQHAENFTLHEAAQFSSLNAEIDNKTFHRLRESFLKSKERFEKYLNKHTKDK